MNLDPIELNRGSPFTFENTGASEVVLTITTQAGTQIQIRLVPGAGISMPSVAENLNLSYAPGSPPGIGIAELSS